MSLRSFVHQKRLPHNSTPYTSTIVFLVRKNRNVPVLDSGARGATITFVERGIGGWQAATKTHFADGGTFDRIHQPGAH